MTTTQGKLHNKVAVITGGNRGLGFASARLFADEGAKIVLFSRDPVRNQEAVEELKALGAEALAVDGSITAMADIEKLIGETVSHFGKIDILFINQGITEVVNFLDITEECYDRLMNTNTRGSFFTIQKAVPHMPKGASIILCTSSSVHLALPDQIPYTASKQALDSFRRTLSAALKDRGIRVNSVCPGMMLTEMHDYVYEVDGDNHEAAEEAIRQFIPAGRGADPIEVARAALFLASDDSSYMLGSEIIVDGGVSMAR